VTPAERVRTEPCRLPGRDAASRLDAIVSAGGVIGVLVIFLRAFRRRPARDGQHGARPVDAAPDGRAVRAADHRPVFFAGKLIFERDSWYQRLLHNETAAAVERRLQFAGLSIS
jgi:hypothetical protein